MSKHKPWLGKVVIDESGRQILPGDILKVHHYTDPRRRRRVYMYKLAFASDAECKPNAAGPYLRGACIYELASKPLAEAHSYPLSDGCGEIIDSDPAGDTWMDWYDRPKVPRAATDKAEGRT
jgi:hypothetical protein